MFTRIMAMVMIAILLTTAALSAVWWVTLRSRQIDARLEALTAQARDIAYLAANLNSSGFESYFYGNPTRAYLAEKATRVNDEFGAYIAVVDRRGNVMDNLRTAYDEDPDFVYSLSGEEISQALVRILSGETIRLRSSAGDAPTFTVGVPFIQNDTVTGAVFIQTRAQRIESGLSETLGSIIAVAAAMILLSGVAVFFFLRSALRPLGRLTTAAGSGAGGDFTVRVEENRGAPELREMARTFNAMASKLQGVEEGRREFVANVSHELRTPITSIRGFAQGLADGVIPEEDRESTLRLIAEESKRISDLVTDLLTLSRMDREDAKPDFTVFDINEMLRRAVIRRMNEIEEKRIDIACECEADPCPVRADSDRIEQVVINLLDNALRFTPEGGEIRLESAVRGREVEVTVRDSGPGVAPEDRERVFERFFTADRARTSGKGTGLGLSICRRIMELHGRSICLLDTEKGAAFRFTLERAESRPAGALPREGGDPGGEKGGSG